VCIHIEDNYLAQKHYDELCSLHIEYSKVHWIGANSASSNALSALVFKTYPNNEKLTGATAWYNIRPTHPQWHDDINSYCTYNNKPYYPKKLPDYTYLYYMKSPNKDGLLEIETGDMIYPKVNRLVYFPCKYKHRVLPYEGNRVSVGIIWWYDLPSIYGNLSKNETAVIDRVWEKEDADNLGQIIEGI